LEEKQKYLIDEIEDFVHAKLLQEFITRVYENNISAAQYEVKMLKAAEDEDYAEAERLKLQRDTTTQDAMNHLVNAVCYQINR
jgi:hypothetical protein